MSIRKQIHNNRITYMIFELLPVLGLEPMILEKSVTKSLKVEIIHYGAMKDFN